MLTEPTFHLGIKQMIDLMLIGVICLAGALATVLLLSFRRRDAM